MPGDLTLALRIRAQLGDAMRQLDRLEKELGETGRAGEKAGRGADQMARGVDQAGRAAERARRSFRRLDTAIGTLGGHLAAGALTRALAAPGRLIGGAVRATIRQEQALAQVAARLRSTGREAETTTGRIAEIAAALQRVTTAGDEAILEAQGVLLTFTNTANDTEAFTVTDSTTPPPPPDPTLPVADAPAVTIAAVSTVGEGATQTLTASVSGGTYDGLSYAWTVVTADGGTISGSGASVTYTAPSVTANKIVTVRCTVTATGTGTNAQSGTSDTAADTESFTVTDAAPLAPTSFDQWRIARGIGSPEGRQQLRAISHPPSVTTGQVEIQASATSTFVTTFSIVDTSSFSFGGGRNWSGFVTTGFATGSTAYLRARYRASSTSAWTDWFTSGALTVGNLNE